MSLWRCVGLGAAWVIWAALASAQQPPAPTMPPPPPAAPSPALPPPLTGGITGGKQVTLQALDKVTARLTSLSIDIGKPARFGQLEILALACLTRPPTEPPDHLAFIRVTEIRRDTAAKVVFSGWMFASSPALNALEHPVYDVWVTECRN